MIPDQTSETSDIPSKSEDTIEDDSAEDETTTKSSTNRTRNEKTRKVTHSEIERRRREKMNRHIDEIAQLLPIDAAKKLDKLTVLRAAVDTIKHLKGSSSRVSSAGFGKQIYLNENELLELTIATMDQIGTYFFLIVECQTGRICYASSSVETIFGYKSIEFCSQSIFDLVHSSDQELIKLELNSERQSSSSTSEETGSNDPKGFSLLTQKNKYPEVGNRRAFSCRVQSKPKRIYGTPTTTTTSANVIENYQTVDFVGYLKEYHLTNEQNETKARSDRRRTQRNFLTPSDVFEAIGTNPVLCFLTMGNISKRFDTNNESFQTIERMFVCKLNSDGQFTYCDQICHSLLGYLSNELMEMTLHELIHDDDREKISELWSKVCCDRQVVSSSNYRFRTKDNTYVILQTIFEPVVHPWTNDLDIIVSRNKIKMKSARSHGSASNKCENVASAGNQSPSSHELNDIVRRLLP